MPLKKRRFRTPLGRDGVPGARHARTGVAGHRHRTRHECVVHDDATIEERVGGAISFDFGDENCGEDISSGKVTAWDPPVRVAYEEYGWNGDAPPVATEVTVTARSGDRCVVRMVHTMVTDKDDWDGELESFETGWPGFFEILKVYLEHFAGAQAATVRASAVSPGGEKQAWSKMTGALNIAGANVGDRCETPDGTPRLAGRVERIHQDASHAR